MKPSNERPPGSLALRLLGRVAHESEFTPHDPAALSALDRHLEGLLEQARARWPDVRVRDEDYLEHVARHVTLDRSDSPALAVRLLTALESLRGPELYLARACADGDARAIERFEELVRSELNASFKRLKSRGTDADDLKQRLFQRLFAATGERTPRILEYSGRGSLRAWVKVSAVRERIGVERRRGDKADSLDAHDDRLMQLADANDPELGFLKSHYRAHFKRAFQTALVSLSPKQRGLLRLSIVDGVSATEIARMYKVHRATSKRWLASARGQLLEATRDHLIRVLRVDPTEFESIIRLIQSNLEVSMRRFLDEHAPSSSERGSS